VKWSLARAQAGAEWLEISFLEKDLGNHVNLSGLQVEKSDASHELALVKLYLEYSYFWTPQCRTDFDQLQEVATEVVRGLEHPRYKQSLGEPNFSRLEKRCQMEDVSDIYTIFWVVIEEVEPDCSELHCDGTRSRHKLQLKKFYLYLTSNIFILRVIMHWNNLPKETGS